MMLGVVVVGFGLDTSGRVPEHLQNYLLVGGMIFVLTSAFSAAFGYYRTLTHDNTMLLLSTKGLSFQSANREDFIEWKTLQTIHLHKNTIIIQSKNQQYYFPAKFLGTSPKRLVETITETQKKVLLGVLR